MKLSLAMAAVVLSASPAFSQVAKKWTDERGVVHYSNSPAAPSRLKELQRPPDPKETVAKPVPQRASPSLCEIDKDGAIERNVIYKIEGNYQVYVQPIWYEMPVDWKRTAAAYIAMCKLGGAARFLDARTGNMVARWGSNGYVSY